MACAFYKNCSFESESTRHINRAERASKECGARHADGWFGMVGGPVDRSDGFDGCYARRDEATDSPSNPPRIAPDQGLLQMGQPPPVQPST
jgi:hypothetical protein